MSKLEIQSWLVLSVIALVSMRVEGVFTDWAEGAEGKSDGATRDYYNRAARLAWENYLGDWRDAQNQPQGNTPYTTVKLIDNDTPRFIEWEVTSLVQEWLDGKYPNQGVFLRGIEGKGSYHFRSREYANNKQRPKLILTTSNRTLELIPTADTYLEPSTYRSQGKSETLKITMKSNPTLLRFDLSRMAAGTRIRKAILRLYTYKQYGDSEIIAGVFRCAQGHDEPETEPRTGLAANYPADRGIQNDSDVIYFADFESGSWEKGWSYVGGSLQPVQRDANHRFEAFQNQALRVKIAEGSNQAMNVTYKFQKKIGAEPEEIYFRYYLRLGDDWNQTLQGGKIPGISGTYGIAGWGGRKSNGNNGWSARGTFSQSIPDGNPLAGTHPIGTYCYHADQKGQYGDSWLWQKNYRGYLRKNQWYCIEQYLKLNTPGEKGGIMKAWVDGKPAFAKSDIRFRHTGKLKIEQIWMNIYHGGKLPSPYDQHCYVDNVVIARKYIGPIGKHKMKNKQ